MSRWLVFENIREYRDAFVGAARAQGNDVVEFSPTAEARQALVDNPAQLLGSVDFVYYDLFLEGERVISDTGIASDLAAVQALDIAAVKNLDTLLHLESFATNFPAVNFLVATRYGELPTVRTCVEALRKALPNVHLIDKPEVAGAIESWCTALLDRAAGLLYALASDAKTADRSWAIFSFRDEAERTLLRHALSALGYEPPKRCITSESDLESLARQAPTVPHVWFEVWKPSGELINSALNTLGAIAAACPFTSFWVPVLRNSSGWPELHLMHFDVRNVSTLYLADWSVETLIKTLRGVLGLVQEVGSRHWGDPIIMGQSEAAQALRSLIEKVAKVDSCVLITGETGTGKGLVAQAIHYRSARRHGPFASPNCAAIPETVLESELFGHERGGFTGASALHRGWFERTNGGSLFLDEIGDISPTMQVKLLRVTQDRHFERIGGEETLHVDVRILAATNRDIDAMVKGGRFREDLFYRLNGVRVDVPSLQARKGDIPLLAEHFVRKHSVRARKRILGLDANAKELLTNHSWPGNIRELEHVIENALLSCSAGLISVDDLPADIRDPARCVSRGTSPRDRGPVEPAAPEAPGPLQEGKTLATLVAEALTETGLAKAAAATRLNIDEKTLDELLVAPEVRTAVVDAIVKDTSRSVNEVSSALFPTGKRTGAYRQSFVFHLRDPRVLEWLRARVARIHGTKKPDLKYVSTDVESILREKAIEEGLDLTNASGPPST